MEGILKASDAEAKKILVALCGDTPGLARRAADHLNRMRAMADESKQGVKRKADSTISICIQCQEPFVEEDNNDKACRYHAGNLEIDYDAEVWADADEAHGEIDTDENRVEFPEGFVWDCCEKLGYAKGCTWGKHDATSGTRGRYGDAPGTYSEPENDEEEGEEDDGEEEEEEEEEE